MVAVSSIFIVNYLYTLEVKSVQNPSIMQFMPLAAALFEYICINP